MATQDYSRRGLLRSASAAAIGAVGSSVLGEQLAPPDRQPPNLKVPTAKKRVRWAVVGLGELALGQIMPAFGACERSGATALVSGHREKAERVAATYGLDPRNIYNYQNFDTISDNPEIDVVYIVLPNSMHAEYTIRALKAGKHVLCEKPMAATSQECREMIAAARSAQRKLMVAYRLHYEPVTMRAREVVRSGKMGAVRIFEAQNHQDTKAPNIRLSRELAGGPVGDVGVYCINAARMMLGEEPVEVTAMKHSPEGDARFAEVPGHVAFQMRFPSGAIAICSCGFDGARSERWRATCEKGWAEMEPAFGYAGETLVTLEGEAESKHKVETKNQFAAEMDHFSQCVVEDLAPRTPGEEGLRDMVIVEKIHDSMREGGRVATIEG